MAMQQKNIVLIKFGGSILTDKSEEKSVHLDVLRSLVAQIKDIRRRRPDLSIVIGHGQGSFAHYPAKKYALTDGFTRPDSQYGFAVTLDVVAKLNRIVVAQLLDAGLPAVSLFPSQLSVAKNGAPHTVYIETLEQYLNAGLLPVFTGDAIIDLERGCTIWSADFTLPYFARRLRDQGWNIERIIHVTKTPGVYRDIEKPELGVLKQITPSLFAQLSSQLKGAEGVDVTGGMLEKVRQAVEIAQEGIETVIISNSENNLVHVICDEMAAGTIVSS